METRRLEYFVTLVREHSFRRAAAALYISQPALSQQIQRLEHEVGAILINRNVSPFELTPAGKRLLARSQRILDELRAIEDVAARARRGLVGKLKIGIAPSLMFSALPGLVRSFRAEFPEVDVTLHREGTATILELVAEQRLDVGMLFSQPGYDGLVWHKLFDDSFVVALPADHPLAARGSVELAELRDEVFLMLLRRGVPDLHDAMIAACASAGFSPRAAETDLQVEGAGYVDQIGLVAGGYGIALIPRCVATLTLESVVYRPLKNPAISLPISLCVASAARNASLDAFVDYCVGVHAGVGTSARDSTAIAAQAG